MGLLYSHDGKVNRESMTQYFLVSLSYLTFSFNVIITPYLVGLQHKTILGPEPYGLPLEEITIAQRLKMQGYTTHMVGKVSIGLIRSVIFYVKELCSIASDFFFQTFRNFVLEESS